MKKVPQLFCLFAFLVSGSVLAQVPNAEKVSSLIRNLTNQNVEVRRSASEALERMGPEAKAASSALGQALKDSDQVVRYNAAQALGRIGAEAKPAIQALAGALSDPSKDVRQSAAWALGKIGAEARAVTPALIEALKDKDKDVRRTAAWALAISGAEERAAVPVLLEALTDDVESNRETAARALGRIGVEAKKALPNLVNTLEDVNQDVRRIAATAIGNIAISLQHGNEVDSIDQLKQAYNALLKHSDRDVRDQAYVVKQAIDGLELMRSRNQKEETKGGWDLITLLTVIASVSAILGFLYFLLFGQKSLPEYWNQFRARRAETTREKPPDTSHSGRAVPLILPQSQADYSTVLYRDLKRITALSCSEDGKFFAFGGFSQRVLLLAQGSSEPIEIASHNGIVRGVLFCALKQSIASCSDDGVIRLTDLSTNEFRIVGKHSGPVYALAFHPNAKLIASVGKDSVARLWTIDSAPIQKCGSEPRFNGVQMRAFKHRQATLFSVDFNRAGDMLATAGVKGNSFVWNMQTGKARKLTGFKESVFCVRFDPSGKFIVGSGADSTIRIWNLITDECKILKGHGDAVRWVSFHESGRLLISASRDRTLRLWDLTTTKSWVLDGHTDYVYGVEFHPNGREALSVSGDGTLRTWLFPPEVYARLESKQ